MSPNQSVNLLTFPVFKPLKGFDDSDSLHNKWEVHMQQSTISFRAFGNKAPKKCSSDAVMKDQHMTDHVASTKA